MVDGSVLTGRCTAGSLEWRRAGGELGKKNDAPYTNPSSDPQAAPNAKPKQFSKSELQDLIKKVSYRDSSTHNLKLKKTALVDSISFSSLQAAAKRSVITLRVALPKVVMMMTMTMALPGLTLDIQRWKP